MSKRRSPRRHPVRTKHPRYNTTGYERGSGNGRGVSTFSEPMSDESLIDDTPKPLDWSRVGRLPRKDIPKNWKILYDNPDRTVFVKSKGSGVVTIETIPEVDVKTIEITGYTYNVQSTKKHAKSKSFKTYDDAFSFAKKRMKEFN